MGQSSHGKNKVHRYYNHSKIDKKDKLCSVKYIRADEVEKAVLKHLDKILEESGHLNKIEGNIKSFLLASNDDLNSEKELNTKALYDLEMEIESVLKFHFSLDAKSQASQLLAEKLEKLAEQKKSLKAALASIKDRSDATGNAWAAKLHLEDNLKKFNRGWKKATPIVQKRFLRRMIDCLIYTPEEIKAYYHFGIEEVSTNQSSETKKAEGQKPLAFSFLSVNQTLRRLLVGSNLSIESASAFDTGYFQFSH